MVIRCGSRRTCPVSSRPAQWRGHLPTWYGGCPDAAHACVRRVDCTVRTTRGAGNHLGGRRWHSSGRIALCVAPSVLLRSCCLCCCSASCFCVASAPAAPYVPQLWGSFSHLTDGIGINRLPDRLQSRRPTSAISCVYPRWAGLLITPYVNARTHCNWQAMECRSSCACPAPILRMRWSTRNRPALRCTIAAISVWHAQVKSPLGMLVFMSRWGSRWAAAASSRPPNILRPQGLRPSTPLLIAT